jgi:hypothetical protein
MHINTCWPTGVLPQIGASVSAQCERCPHAVLAHSLDDGRCEACGMADARDAWLALTTEAKAYVAARAAGYIVGPDGVPYGPFTEAESGSQTTA